MLDPDGVDQDLADASNPNALTIKLFNFGVLTQWWQNHEYEEVGMLESERIAVIQKWRYQNTVE